MCVGEQIIRATAVPLNRDLRGKGVRCEATAGRVSEVEMVYQGRYYLDAASTAAYHGFTLWNWRGEWQVNPQWRLFTRVMNIADIRYADRADIAFGSFRYFPGTPRQVYAGVELSLGGPR